MSTLWLTDSCNSLIGSPPDHLSPQGRPQEVHPRHRVPARASRGLRSWRLPDGGRAGAVLQPDQDHRGGHPGGGVRAGAPAELRPHHQAGAQADRGGGKWPGCAQESSHCPPPQECVDVPKEVCTWGRGNPKKVRRPVIKKWCYTPSREAGLWEAGRRGHLVIGWISTVLLSLFISIYFLDLLLKSPFYFDHNKHVSLEIQTHSFLDTDRGQVTGQLEMVIYRNYRKNDVTELNFVFIDLCFGKNDRSTL